MDPEKLFDTNFLLGRVQAGDERAIELLYQRYIRRVEGWTRGRVPRSARSLYDTQTVAHDVLVKAIFKTTEEGQEIRSSFQGYVRRAVRNRIIDIAEMAKRWNFQALEGELPETAPTELEKVLERDFEAHVRAKIDQLPRESRELLHLRFERDLEFGSIAELLGLPSADAARMRVNRVLSVLRDELKGAA